MRATTSSRSCSAASRSGPDTSRWLGTADGAIGAIRSAIPGHVRRLARVLDFWHVAPRVRLAPVEVGESVDPRELPARQRLTAPARDVGILRKRDDRATDERGALRDREVGDAR